jgi:hypothetical protein
LWQAFQNLKSARNTFLHEGEALIGKAKEEITNDRAGKLTAEAKNIANCVESLLPAELRRPILTQEIKWKFTKMLTAPTPAEQPPAASSLDNPSA